MIVFLKELRRRNPLLYWFGWLNFTGFVICVFLIFYDKQEILGINRWIKPSKFFLSVGIMVWSMGWIMYYLRSHKTTIICSVLIMLTMFVENALITWQAYKGQPSHFNISTTQNALIFSVMGAMIISFSIVVAYITFLFFRLKSIRATQSYCWGMRMGLLLFLFFSLEGGLMVQLMKHTVGGADGSAGLPYLNWSTKYGDLRIVHFMGMHALQFIPLAGYYMFKTRKQVLLFSLTYFLATIALLVLALLGMPIIPFK
jgi:hypothetical protein